MVNTDGRDGPNDSSGEGGATPTIPLKAIRGKAGLSLAQAAELTGVSKAMLGQIERGESSPTLITLWKLAKGFHLPLSAFIEGLTEPTQPPATSTGAPTRPARPVNFGESISFDTLFAFDPAFGSETFLIHLKPGQTHVSHPHDAGVVEDIFVTEGVVEIELDGEWSRYHSGDALRFRADQPHSYRNPGRIPARFHNTIHYPQRG
ncbi:helix-turn-helix domain-containing protein [Celeribacter neptunius]|uniref:Transcriptional regulator, XRE family with cupin sensor n=1 Tax=Celeribacter neptunius TaxID=588602 RepID=A0A1I3PDA5_9RHOB|nr:XRE family transcriptional regulator [Celeribacter neptunius]SFJ19538.1 transcriptional regulator, XRE family with cupin sensor [Celeribacter neptunius]